MDLTVVVHGHDTDHCLSLAVAREQHRSLSHPLGHVSVRKRGAAEAVVVLGIEVGYEIESIHEFIPVRGHFRSYGVRPPGPQ